MVISGVAQALRVLQDVLHAVHQVRQELRALRIAEQRAPHRRYLHQTRQRERGQRVRQGMVEVEEELERREIEEHRSPTSRYLDRAEVVRRFVRRGSDEVECEAVLGQLQQLSHESVLALVVEVEVLAVLSGRLQQGAGEAEYLEELRVAEGRCDLAVLCQRPVRFHLGDLVHLACQLGQELDTYHAVFYRTLEKI